MILTSNTEATENKVQFFNLAYSVKGFQCHSNNSLQMLGKKKTKTKQYTLFKVFFGDIPLAKSCCNTWSIPLTDNWHMHLPRLQPIPSFAVV